MWRSSQGFLNVLMSWQVVSPGVSDPGEREKEKEATVPFMTWSFGSHAPSFPPESIHYKQSLTTAHSRGRGIRLHFLKGEVSREIMNIFYNYHKSKRIRCLTPGISRTRKGKYSKHMFFSNIVLEVLAIAQEKEKDNFN